MRFNINAAPSFEELKTKLNNQFPEYSIKMQGKQFLIVKKTSTCAVFVLVRKNKMIVNGNFPTMGGRLIFTLTFILLGIIPPLIIYFFTFHKKFKAMEEEVGGFLKRHYGTGND
ncbi:MAG: hypothetical protein AB8B74_13025 [Crocinitomicaceae bacterium]